ncbi:hypothetical protein RIF29_11467 [Crotalaria pallida]|uniref:Cyclic nucleotide-binding domain-containing protein n=1 Tax=Crotalaria pallida TaxID=3830 RepID=A0AAN9IM43_CROPI
MLDYGLDAVDIKLQTELLLDALVLGGALEEVIYHIESYVKEQVYEMKAEYSPPKVDIIMQNQLPTDFYILVSGSLDVLT